MKGSSRTDARLLELEFLGRLVRSESVVVRKDENIPQRDMIVHLLAEGMVNDAAGLDIKPDDLYRKWIEKETSYERNTNICQFLIGLPIELRISHRGRVRLSELEQALKTGREREPFGILLAARHWERDLRMALLSASKETPVALGFLDMNGLKAINDSLGHEAGNEAIRAFLRTVAAIVDGTGDAYRYGGDEVIVILPATNVDAAAKLMTILLRQLGEEKIDRIGKLTASCGVGVADDPDIDPKTFSEAVDAIQYKAKAASKEGPQRRSVLAIEGNTMQVL